MPQYYEKKQTSKFRIKEITPALRGMIFTFHTAGGIFSAERIDPGTKLLVDSCIMEDGWTVLDMGCGYGVVGIVIKKVYPHGDVFMVDVNERAIALAEQNAAINGVQPHIRQGNLFEPLGEMQFDTILLNPPYIAGRKLIFIMLTESQKHLKKGGLLQVVARHQKGGKTIAAKMKEMFGNVLDHARKGGYHVYVSRK